MRGKFEILMVIAVLGLPGVTAGETGSRIERGEIRDIETFASRLDALSPFAASVRYAVTLPMAEDDVVYKVEMASETTLSDSLSHNRYILDWTLPLNDGESHGFTSYFDGHLYRYRDHRLQEYHYQWDSIPFRTPGGGVHRNGQFVDLLPSSLATHLRRIAVDSTYTLSVSQGSAEGEYADIIKAVRRINGLECQRYELALASQSGIPLKLSVLYNPGMLGEQEVDATYDYSTPLISDAPESEQALMASYPEVFDKYRISNYSVENLRGLPLPEIALPTTTGERYLHHKGEPFPSPTVIAVLDPTVASTSALITSLRRTIDAIPRQTGLLLIFRSNDIDAIEPLAGQLRPGETFLTSATPFIRDCGINAYPTVILCDRYGKVADVILGAGSSLPDRLQQGTALME